MSYAAEGETLPSKSYYKTSLVLLMRQFKFHSIDKLDVVQQNTQDDLRLNESVYNLTPECNRKNPLCTPHIYYTRAFNVHLFQVHS